MTDYPHLDTAIEDALYHSKATCYDELKRKQKNELIAALVEDTPETDIGELVTDASLIENIALFLDGREEGDLLRKRWIRFLEERYKKLLNARIQEKLEAQEPRHRQQSEKQEWLQSDNRQRYRDYMADQRCLIRA